MAMTKQEKLDAKLEKAYYRKHMSHIKLTGGDVTFYIIDYIVFGLFALICFFPFYCFYVFKFFF